VRPYPAWVPGDDVLIAPRKTGVKQPLHRYVNAPRTCQRKRQITDPRASAPHTALASRVGLT